MAAEHPHSRQYLAEQIANSRELTADSRKLLGNAKPNSFAGRKTQEPFPQEADPVKGYLHSRELQPPE